MSGIVGCWLEQPQRFHQAARDVGIALEKLKHRGPDDCGLWHNANRTVVLGHRRLAIVDLSPGGHQPMPFIQEQDDEELVVLFDGEIYNFRELQEDLETHGYEFYSDSDTEVLLAAYHHFGRGFLDHLRGTFAFSIWDARTRTMLLARDRMGKKPLYYTANEAGLFFASELNALKQLIPHELLAVDRQAIDGYLAFGSMLGRRTVYKNVWELPPATAMFCRSPHDVSEHRYWTVEQTSQRKMRLRDAVEETDRILHEAVRLRMQSEVPAGVLLSGSVENALIAALAAEATDHPVSTFCIGPKFLSPQELALSQAVATRYRTDHTELAIQPDLTSQLPDLARQFGEPFADASAVMSYLVSEAAAYHCTVLLNGDGGDELFCGHRRYLAVRRAERLRPLFGGALGRTLARLALVLMPGRRTSGGGDLRWHDVLTSLTATGANRVLNHVSTGFSQSERQSLYTDDFQPAAVSTLFDEEFPELLGLAPLEALLAFDFQSLLPDKLLLMTDIASMANSVEVRSPLLDQQVVEWAHSIPLSRKSAGSRTKPVLRALAKRYLPKGAVDISSAGVAAPLEQWLNGGLKEMRDDLILNRSGLMGEYFDRDALEWLLSPKGRRRMSASRWPQLVWSLLMLALWDQECWSAGQYGLPPQAGIAA